MSQLATIDPDGEPVGELKVEWATCTDLANAGRLAQQFGSSLRYVPLWGSWLVWDGRRWRKDDIKRVWRFARATVRSIYVEAGKELDADKRAQLVKHAVKSESRGALAAMIDLASSEPGIPVTPIELDADPYMFNTASGTIDLRTGEMHPHDRGDLITKLAPVTYNPAAAAPAFEKFLARIFAGNKELIEYNQRLLGSSLVGEQRDHILPVAHGVGSNGKTTLMESVVFTLGDYAMAAAPDLLLESDHDRHPTEIADLFGVRLAVCREPNRGVHLDEAKVKSLTGNDTIKARHMRMDFFSFKPSHTLILIVNHKPIVRGADTAIWRRLKLIPFNVVIPETEWDTELPAKLQREAGGILAWLVAGCLAWQRIGLSQPKAVTEATDGYKSEMDSFGVFLAERCVVDKAAEVPFRDLWSAYLGFCEREREKPMSKTSLGLALAERGFQRRTSGVVIWTGLRLLVGLVDFPGSSHEAATSSNQRDNPTNPTKSSSKAAQFSQLQLAKTGPKNPPLSDDEEQPYEDDDLAAGQLDAIYPDAETVAQ